MIDWRTLAEAASRSIRSVHHRAIEFRVVCSVEYTAGINRQSFVDGERCANSLVSPRLASLIRLSGCSRFSGANRQSRQSFRMGIRAIHFLVASPTIGIAGPFFHPLTECSVMIGGNDRVHGDGNIGNGTGEEFFPIHLPR